MQGSVSRQRQAASQARGLPLPAKEYEGTVALARGLGAGEGVWNPFLPA